MKNAFLLAVVLGLFSHGASAINVFRFALRGVPFYISRASNGAIGVFQSSPAGAVLQTEEFVYHAETTELLGFIEQSYPTLSRPQIDVVMANFAELVRNYLERSALEQNFERLHAAQWVQEELRAQLQQNTAETVADALNRLQLEIAAHQAGDTRTVAQLVADASEAAMAEEARMVLAQAQREFYQFQRGVRLVDDLTIPPRIGIGPKGLFFNTWWR